MLKVIESNGDNTYEFPLNNRGVLERDVILNTTVVVCDDIMKNRWRNVIVESEVNNRLF